MGNAATKQVDEQGAVPFVEGPVKSNDTEKQRLSDDATTVASSTVVSLPVSEINSSDDASVESSLSQECVSSPSKASENKKCTLWDGTKFYSDLIQDGLRYLNKSDEGVIMLFESPSTASKDTSFYNSQVFPIHDYPPSDPCNKTVLAPLR